MLDVAVGESRPGRPLRTDDVMLWYSAGKPLTTVAVLQLWEQRRLELDDLVAEFVPGWGAGKERATIRHLLTHTGGFPMFGADTFDRDVTYADGVAAVAATPAEWEPGTAAGVSRDERVADPRRDRRSRRRSTDRPVRARRGPRAARRVRHVARDLDRRASATR